MCGIVYFVVGRLFNPTFKWIKFRKFGLVCMKFINTFLTFVARNGHFVVVVVVFCDFVPSISANFIGSIT